MPHSQYGYATSQRYAVIYLFFYRDCDFLLFIVNFPKLYICTHVFCVYECMYICIRRIMYVAMMKGLFIQQQTNKQLRLSIKHEDLFKCKIT